MRKASLGAGMLAALLAAPVNLVAADPFDGAAVNVWQVSAVDASAARAQMLAQALGLSGSPVETDISFLISGPPDATGHPAARLILHKASGAVEYFNSAAAPNPGVKPQLPAAPDALKSATALVDKLGLMPANATTTTTEIDGVDSTGTAYGAMLRVVFSPQLAIAGTDQAPILTPVDHADVTVDLGDGGAVIALTSFWRPASSSLTAAQRGETAAWQDFTLEESSLNPTQPNVTLSAHYFAYPPDEVQPFYDPLYLVLDGGGNIMAAAPATDFTPRLTSLLPDGSAPVDGSRPVQLSAAAEAGTPPYRFSWETAHGGALGEGASLAASLPNGPQAIGLTIRDARGAGYRVWETIQIADSTVRPRFGENTPQRGFSLMSRAWAQTNPLTWSTPGVQQVSGPNGTNFDAELPAGHHGVRVARVQHANIIFINSVFLDQWRYEIDVSINGTTYHLRSLKCIDDKLATTGSACYFPPNPFAVPSSTAASATLTISGGTAMAESLFAATSLPGDFSLHFKYASENISNPGCDPGTMASIGSYLMILKSRSVGGKCPGFTPEVDWTYKPPESNAMTGAEIVQWCETAPATTDGYKTCDVPSDVMGSVVASQNYTIVGFQAWLFTRVAPLGNQTMVTTLLQDTNSAFDVAKSMGTLIRANLPSWLIGDMFSEILPISRELEVTVAKPVETRGDWDNFHAKASPWLGRLKLVDYPACTSVLDKTDTAPCLHLHESWLGGPTISKGQTVKWIIVLYKPAEVDPLGLPDDLANGETLFTPASGASTSKVPPAAYIGGQPVFTQQVIWQESQASSDGCAPPAAGTGGIDNTARPCAVFVSPLFFTH